MDWKTTILGTYTGLSIIKQLWELFSDRPLITGAFDLATFLSRYWLLVVSIPIFLLIVLPPIVDKLKGLQPTYGKHFTKEEILLDGKRFVECTFADCTFVYEGGKFVLDTASFTGVIHIHSNNPVISRTLILLKAMNALSPEMAKSLRRSEIRRKR